MFTKNLFIYSLFTLFFKCLVKKIVNVTLLAFVFQFTSLPVGTFVCYFFFKVKSVLIICPDVFCSFTKKKLELKRSFQSKQNLDICTVLPTIHWTGRKQQLTDYDSYESVGQGEGPLLSFSASSLRCR